MSKAYGARSYVGGSLLGFSALAACEPGLPFGGGASAAAGGESAWATTGGRTLGTGGTAEIASGGAPPSESGGAPQSTGGTPPSSGGAIEAKIERMPPEPIPGSQLQTECLTVTPSIATRDILGDIALCFGLSRGAVFECDHSTNVGFTTCKTLDDSFVVDFDPDEKLSSLFPWSTGIAYSGVEGASLALVYQHPDVDEYWVEWGDGRIGKCNPQLTEYCLHSRYEP
jgi:hypothetical protein